MAQASGRPAGESLGNPKSAPMPDEVRDQLARILTSSDFSVPERVRSFLRFVVEQTLCGHGDRLKGYTIATAVFDRGTSFDAQADPVVRTEAQRLRRALERYYLVAGKSDPIVIDMPKGSYIPTFTHRIAADSRWPAAEPKPTVAGGSVATEREPVRHPPWRAATLVLATLIGLAAVLGSQQWRRAGQGETVAGQASPDSPTLLVVPFATLGDDDEAAIYAAGITEEILTKLSRYKDLAVQGGELKSSSPATTDPQATAREGPARYFVTGSLRLSGGDLRVASRLVEAATGMVLWAQTYEEDLSVKQLFTIQEDIAQQVVTTIAQPYGVVFRSELRRTADQPPDDLEAYACTLRFYVYRAGPTPESHALVRRCLERALASFPGYATAWAMQSVLALDEDRFAFNRQSGDPGPIERALRAARRAVDLDADNARGLQALMMALFFSGEVDEAERVGEQALAANPHDTELLGEFGLRIALAGQWERGRELVERALARDPAYAGYGHAVLALIAYMQRDGDRAEAEIRQANLVKFSLYHAIAAIIYADRGLTGEAHREAALFTKLHPDFVANLESELRKRNLRPEDHARIVLGLLKAGVQVPAESAAAAARWPHSS